MPFLCLPPYIRQSRILPFCENYHKFLSYKMHKEGSRNIFFTSDSYRDFEVIFLVLRL